MFLTNQQLFYVCTNKGQFFDEEVLKNEFQC